MPDLPPLPPGFTLDQPQPSPVGRPVIRKGTPPVAPPSGYRPTPSGGLEFIPGGPADPNAKPAKGDTKPQPIPGRAGWFMDANGNAFQPKGLPKGSEAGDKQRDAWLAVMKATGVDLAKGIDPVKPLIEGSTSGRVQTAGANLYGDVTGEATAGMENIGKLETIVSDITLQLTGGSLGNQISNSDRDFIMQRVGNLGDPTVPANKRLAAWEQVKQRMANITGTEAAPESSDEPTEAAVPPTPLITPSTGETRSVVDPKAQRIAGRIGSLIAQGADFKRIMGTAVGMDPSLRNDPKFRKSVEDAIGQMQRPEVRNYVQKTGSYPFDPSFYTREEPLGTVEGALNSAAQSAPGAYAARAGDAVTAGNLDRLVSLGGGDPESARLALEFAGQDNPFAATAGDVSGGILAALMGEAGLARLGMGPGLLRSVGADSTYGAITNASNAREGNVLGNLGKGALAAGFGSLGGQALLRGTGNLVRGVSAPGVRYLADERIPMTVGQMAGQSGRVGAFVKNAEDKLSGSGLDGGMISARRMEGLQAMNAKVFDKALEPIGENVAGSYGEEAVAAAQQKVSDAFADALNGKAATVDVDFINDAAKAKMAVQRLPRVGAEVENSIDELISEYFDPHTLAISGENMQALLRDLEGIKKAYRNDPLAHRIGKSVEMVSHSIEGLFRRQAPDVMPKYDAAKHAFKRLSTVEDAVLRGKNTGGIFTSGQLGHADKANTIRFGGKHKAAAGGGEFHDFQRAAQDVLPSKVPDSGTAGRLILPVGFAVGGAGLGATAGDAQSGGQAGLTLGALLTLAYSRAGQRGLTKLIKPGSARAIAIGNKVKNTGRIAGAGTAALVANRD